MEEQLMNILFDLRSDVDFETETQLVTDGVLESFDIVALVAAMTETFDIDIQAKDLLPENFNSFEAMLRMITRLQDEG